MTKWMMLLALTIGCGDGTGTGGERSAYLVEQYGISAADAEFAYEYARAACAYNLNCGADGDRTDCVNTMAEELAAVMTKPDQGFLDLFGWTCEDLPEQQALCVDFYWEYSETCNVIQASEEAADACASILWTCE